MRSSGFDLTCFFAWLFQPIYMELFRSIQTITWVKSDFILKQYPNLINFPDFVWQ
jgi:hypothetical protein